LSKESGSTDIFRLLTEDSKRKKKEKREKLIESVDVKEFFEEGEISIDKKTCKGAECKLCLDACPTNALYWKAGEVGIVQELCIYCMACVWSCIVDDCIHVRRIRPDGEVEEFSTLKDVRSLLQKINTQKRLKRVLSCIDWERKLLLEKDSLILQYLNANKKKR
jgi:Fe-S-cluster-containing hydrogenase component 2